MVRYTGSSLYRGALYRVPLHFKCSETDMNNARTFGRNKGVFKVRKSLYEVLFCAIK